MSGCDGVEGCLKVARVEASAHEKIQSVESRFEKFVVQATEQLGAHLATSAVYMERSQRDFDQTLLQIKECFGGVQDTMRQLNKGAGEFIQLRNDLNNMGAKLEDHAHGENNIHALLSAKLDEHKDHGHHAMSATEKAWLWICVRWTMGAVLLIIMFLAAEHKEFLGGLLKSAWGIIG